MTKILPAFVLIAACVSSAFALAPGDGVVVNFKDGTRMSGVLVRKGRKNIRLDFGGAQMSFPLSEVRSIKPKKNPVKTFQDLMKAAGDDRVKLLAAAEFARVHGLDSSYDRLVARLGIPNELDREDTEDNETLDQRSRDAIAAQAEAEAAINGERRAERTVRREDAREARSDSSPQAAPSADPQADPHPAPSVTPP
jgi:hypothetical protein